jgi:N utilization substance protein A
MPTKKKVRKKTTPKKKASKKKALKKKAPSKKPVRKKKSIRAESSVRRNTAAPAGRTSEVNSGMFRQGRRGLGPNAGGQSGDIQALPRTEDVDSESVEELAEEGQAFEAEVVSGVENAPDADQGEVRTHEVPEDDVPDEYRGKRDND